MALNNTNDTNGMNKEERLEWANGELERAKKLYEKGEYQESIKICEDILPIFEKMETIDEYRDCINYCYANLKAIRNYEKSLQLGTEVLKNISTKLRQDKRLTAITYNNFGSCHNNLGNQNKAIKYHKQALAIYNKDKIKYQANIAYTNYCLANCFFCQTKYKKAIKKSNLALKDFKKDGRDKNIVYFSMVFNLMGMSYLRIGNIKKALCYFEKSLDIRVKLYGHKHPDIAEICGNLGVCFYEKRDYDTAALYLNISNNINKAFDNNSHRNIAFKTNIGAMFLAKKNVNMAFDYFKEVECLMRNITIVPNEKASLYNNIGVCYEYEGKNEKSIEYHQKALNIRLELNKEHIDIATSYLNLGRSYTAKGNLIEGLEYLEKGLNHLLAFHPNNIYIAGAYGNLGGNYMKRKNYKETLKLFQYSLIANIIKYNIENYYHNPKVNEYLSEEYQLTTLKNKIIAFQELYQQSHNIKNLQAALFTAQVSGLWINYIRNSFSSNGSKLFLAKDTFEIFESAIPIAFEAAAVAKNNREKWQAATDEIAEINADSFPKKEFKYCETKQDCLHTAFDFCEQSRAIILLGNMKDDEAKGKFIPKELLEREYDLRVELTYLNKKITDEEYKKEEQQDKKQLLEWQNQLFNYTEEYEKLVKKFEKEYPEYHRLKYNTETVKIPTLQQTLDKNSYIIEYFVSKTHLYTFVIGQNGYKMYEKELPKDFEKHLKDMQKWYHPDYKRSMPSNYVSFAHPLYQILLKEVVEEWQFPQDSTLIIIPDGKLSKIPFEALLTRKPTRAEYKYKNMPYLLMQYDVMYHYSATLYHHAQQSPQRTTTVENIIDGFVGFAPVFAKNAKNHSKDEIFRSFSIEDVQDKELRQDMKDILEKQAIKRKDILQYAATDTTRSLDENGNIVALESSEMEVTEIAKEFENKNLKAVSILHEAATIEQFKKLVPYYKYVLIASHGDFNVERPEQTGILFSPEEQKDTILYMNEVYNLDLNADLLVLSCCESGVGKEAKGEGVMAMNRGFLYAGAKNVIFTLFKIHDKASYLLTSALFRHILAGKTYKKALRLAKKELIQNTEINPVHWSGFVLIGQ